MRDLTQGSVTRHLLQLSLFMSVSLLLQTLYMLADLYWVGALGPESIAALSLAGNLFFVVLAVGQVLAVGTIALVSHAVGAREPDRARFIFNQTTVYGVLLGLLVFVGVCAVRPFYFGWLGADAATAALGRAYLFWLAPAFLAQLAAVGLSGALRGIGDLKTPMWINAAAVLMNVILDPVLIYGWGPAPALGVAGAGLATLLALATAWGILLWFFTRPHSFLRYNPAQWKPDWGLYSRLTRIGLPAGAEFGIMSCNLFVIFWAISVFGASAQAGYGVGQRLLTSLYLPVLALSFANAPVVGQNFGARRGDRVRRSFYAASGLAVAFMLGLTLLCQLAPHWLIRLFSSDAEVVGYGSGYLAIVSWNFVASALVLTTSSSFQGLGHTLPPLVSSLLRFLVFAAPVVWMARLAGFRIEQVWWFWVATIFLQAGLNLVFLRRSFRHRLPAEGLPAPAPEAAD